MKKKKIILIAVSLAILAGGGVWLFGGSTAKHKVTYATATVSKGGFYVDKWSCRYCL
jgi:HlyD family secretion protein